MLRLLDLVFSITGLMFGAPVLLAIYVVGLPSSAANFISL